MLRCFVIIQAMKTRGDCVEEFATFAHHVQSCRRNADSIRQRLDNTTALFEATANICCLTVARVVSYGNSRIMSNRMLLCSFICTLEDTVIIKTLFKVQ